MSDAKTRKCLRSLIVVVALFLSSGLALAEEAKRLAYLDGNNPWYPHTDFPKLTTPQWVGEDGVDAVVILAIDDMRNTTTYERYLRPVLKRLKKIDGRAPVSIMTCRVDPDDSQIQSWLKEGLSIEVHTVDHPCPLLNGGDLAKAKSTYDRCVDLLAKIPNSSGPVAFRMPCCDSQNTVSPRFYSQIFDKQTPQGNYLQLSSSVFNLFTPADKSIPRELLFDDKGRERLRKYVPHQSNQPPRSRFVNWIENYPYPYVINRTCWEFPCVVPSDWEAQHLHRPNNPTTVSDMKAALDITVHKKGVYCLVFHPHGWIRNDQVVDIINHAVARHGKKVKFLTFPEALSRLNRHLLNGQPLRDSKGRDNGVRLVDVNQDGYLDVLIGNRHAKETRVWQPGESKFATTRFAADLTGLSSSANRKAQPPAGTQFVLMPDRSELKLLHIREPNGPASGGVPSLFAAQRFSNGRWENDEPLSKLIRNHVKIGQRHAAGQLVSLIFRETTNHGSSLALVTRRSKKGASTAVYMWSAKPGEWQLLRTQVPPQVAAALAEPDHARVRFVDIDEDGDDDFVLSAKPAAGRTQFLEFWLVDWFATGKATPIQVPASVKLMPIVRPDGSENGFFVRERHLCWQNEDTNRLPDLLHRVSFDQVLHEHIAKQVSQGKFPPPRLPQQSAALIQLKPGLRVELVAAEPLIRDPVAFDWDIRGRLWVVEMGDYPKGVDGRKAGGRIRVLTDTDQDGRFDKATTFMDDIGFPNGIQLWRKGVLVTAAPEIFYAEDSDGDGKADFRKTLYRGFVEGNQQHRVNGLRWGLDNWLYVANGDSGGKVKAVGNNSPAVSISGRDLRIRPDQQLIDPQSGQAQFGRNRDDWGNWFGSNNANPMWQYVLADHYLRRNPYSPVSNTRHVVPRIPGPAPVFPVSRTLPRYNDFGGVNRFTSACSTMIYRDRVLGDELYGNAFTSEPVHNLISRLTLKQDGATFRGQRAASDKQSEFLASRDNWFRPTMIRTGPDGALWFADMYRAVIEHPKWIPAEWQSRLDLRAGHSMGRIYRIVPESRIDCCRPETATRATKRPNSAAAKLRCFFPAGEVSTAQLVSRLASPNGWWRDTAQRLLIHRQDQSAVRLLRTMALQHPLALARLHALCTLEGLQSLTSETIERAVQDSHAGVRRHAIRLSEPMLQKSKTLAAAVAQRLQDKDAFVQMQLAYSARWLPAEQAGQVLGTLLKRHESNRWTTSAALSSVAADNVSYVVEHALTSRGGGSPSRALLASLIRQAVAWKRVDAIAQPLQQLLDQNNRIQPADRWATLAVVGQEFQRSPKLWETLRASQPAWDAALKTAIKVVQQADTDVATRVAALRFAGSAAGQDASIAPQLSPLLRPQSPPALQKAIARTLAASGHNDAAGLLLAGWPGHSPALRNVIVDALLQRDKYRDSLLNGIQNGKVSIVDVDAVRRERLLTTGAAKHRSRAAKLFATSGNPSRQAVVQRFTAALKAKGDVSRGRHVFEKRCSACHKLDGLGKSVGADLSALRDRSGPSLLVAILDPNRAVEAKFLSFSALTDKGRIYSGMLLAETGTSITLVGPDGKQHLIRRAELDKLTSSRRSLMPEGLEKDLTLRDLADVIRFVQSAALPRKKFPGNQPRTIAADKDGVLTLPAAAAEIYGPSIVLEKQFKNLGFWSSQTDHADWTIDVSQQGRYTVELDYAAAKTAAGDELHLTVAGETLKGRVPSTGQWENYRTWKLGSIRLPQGVSRLVVSTPTKPRSAMIDLRTIKLRRVK